MVAPQQKGYVVCHQKVSIELSLDGKIHGTTELTIAPTTSDLKVVWLNARSMNVISASLRVPTTVPLAYSYLPPLPPALSASGNIHTYPELKRAIWKATNEGEEGELGIAIPQGCITKLPQSVAPTPKTPKDKDADKKEEEYEAITFSIEYEVTEPGAGIQVIRPDEQNPSRLPHVFSTASDISARTWVPCADYIKDRCTWDLELVVPRLLYSAQPRRHQDMVEDGDAGADDEPDKDDEDTTSWPITAVASGELIEQIVHPERSDRVIWHFVQSSPVSAQQVAWAVGPFVVKEIASEDDDLAHENDDEEDGIKAADSRKLHALCLPGREDDMMFSAPTILQAMDFYEKTFGSYPFASYTVAFVDSLASGAPTFHSAGLTLFSADILHPQAVIEQAYDTRQMLVHALAIQWSGVNLIARHPSDYWLILGISGYMTSLFLKSLWGNNEYRFRLKKDIMRCVAQDVQHEPLCVAAVHSNPEPEQVQFAALKAPLVLYILDKHLRRSGTSFGLEKVLPKLFLDAIAGEVSSGANAVNYNTLGTNSFTRMCRKLCGGSMESLKIFFDQWVYGSGCPTFTVSAHFNRKRLAIEITIKQECLAYNWQQTAPWEEMGHLRAIDLFDGQMTIRIHEADGTPYEHVLNIQEHYKKHEVPFNTKYKRIRRNTKRYQARAAAATAAANGDLDAQEDMGLVDLGFSLSQWEDEKERERWRVADWSEEDDTTMAQATYEWIRIDSDIDWIANIHFEQSDFMWISQLQRDRDVVAQLEAVHALSSMPSPIVSSNLTKTVLVSKYFIRVRMEAALALIACATKAHDYIGLFQLFKLFQTRYCFDPEEETHDPFAFRCIPKPNDFEDIAEYLLRKTIINAIGMIRDEQGQTPEVVQQFLIDQLMYNDNLGNKYSDTFYITTIMNTLSHTFVAVHAHEAGQFPDQAMIGVNENLLPAIEEVDRLMTTDRLVPSYRNAVSVAGIEWKVKMMMANLVPEDRNLFFQYTRDGNFPAVRMAAFDALLLLNPLENMPLVRYFFSVLQADSSRLVQRRLAHSLMLSLPILAAVQDLAKPQDAFADQANPREIINNILKSLRKVPGRSVNYRQCLLQALTHPDVDPEVRWCLLKICEATVRPDAEPIPKFRFRMPVSSTLGPAAADAPGPLSSAPALPKIRLSTTGPSNAYGRDTENIAPGSAGRAGKVKLKAAPKPKQSQASGMPLSDVAACNSIIKKLLKDKASLLFRAPVDPVKSGAPGYFDIVKNPMDISTMSAKLQAGQYPDRYAFRDDFKLIIQNAILYNVQGIVVDLAKKMDALFDKQWERVERTLKAMEHPGSGPSASAVGAAMPPPPNQLVNDSAGLPPPAALPPIPQATASTSTGLSLKLKAPSSVKTARSASPTPSPAPPAKSGGIKITLGSSSLKTSTNGTAAPTKAAAPTVSPSMSRSTSKEASTDAGTKKKAKRVDYTEPSEDSIPELPALPARPSAQENKPLPDPSKFVNPDEPVSVKKAQRIIHKLRTMREAYFFLYPVQAVGPLETYYDEIKEPMDLHTMEQKLDKGSYRSYRELFRDFNLIVSNCKQFNPPNTEPVWHVEALDRAWRSEWEKASKLSYPQKRSILALLKTVMKEGAAWPFLESINTIIDQVPNYFDIIEKGTERDLGTIKANVEADKYSSVEDVEADIDLMLQNCFTFNAPDNQVYKSGEELQKMFDAGFAKINAEGKKRPGEKSAGGPSKKQKT